MFVRIRFITHDGNMNPTLDSYVMKESLHSCIDEGYLRYLTTNGFTRVGRGDPEERIMPGAIISVTPCNKRGYSVWDLASQKLCRRIEGVTS